MRELIRLRYALATRDDTAEIDLYGAIVENIPEEWKWNPEDRSAAEFRDAVKAAREGGAARLRLNINSPGGLVTEAVAMRSVLNDAGFDAVDIAIHGLCASAATIIATLPGARVTIAKGSEYMIHQPWSIVMGNEEDMRREADHIAQTTETLLDMYEKRTGMDREKLRGMVEEETWMSAEEAVEFGFADEVTDGAQAAACVKSAMYAVMRDLYRRVPEAVTEEKEQEETTAEPVAGTALEIHDSEEPEMDWSTITLDDLRQGNPALYDSALQAGAQAERERLQDIEDLTPIGYEAMMAEAKRSGQSALDYHKAIVKAQREKAAEYLTTRRQETAPAMNIAPGAAEDEKTDSARDEEAYLKNVQKYAASAQSRGVGMY